MAEHTPGPWVWNSQPSDGCCWTHHVETAEKRPPFNMTNAIADVDGEGNARLIAAAPDLLLALQEAYGHFSYLVERGALTREEEPYVESMRRAIVKATGQ